VRGEIGGVAKLASVPLRVIRPDMLNLVAVLRLANMLKSKHATTF
jgi:hypothetical protein